MTTYVTSVLGGFWNNADTWTPKGVPGATDRADIYGPVYVTTDQTAADTNLYNNAALELDGGSLHSRLYGRDHTRLSVTDKGGYVDSIQVGRVTVDASGTLTVGGNLRTISGVTLAEGSALKVDHKGGGSAITGNVSMSSSQLLLGNSVVLGDSIFTMSDSAYNVIKATAADVVLMNQAVITGAGGIGGGTMSFVNGKAGGDSGTVRATGENNALVFSLGPDNSFTNAKGLIEAAGKAGLSISASSSQAGAKLVNNGTMRSVDQSTLEISHVSLVNKGTDSSSPAVILAAGNSSLVLDTIDANNTNGEILAAGTATIELQESEIDGGTMRLRGTGSTLVATGHNVLRNVDFNSAGTVVVGAGSSLAVTGPGSSTIASASVDGRLYVGHQLTLQGKGKVAVAGEISTGSAALINVDEQISGSGTLSAASLANRESASIVGALKLEIGGAPADSGKLVNHGLISGAKIKAKSIDNAGTISNVTFNVPYIPSDGDSAIENDAKGVISSAVFGRSLVVGDGLIQADGAGQVTSFAGTKLHGGTLSSGNGGKIVVKAAAHATVLDPTKIAAGTTIAVDNGASLDLDGPDTLDKVSISVAKGAQATTLNLTGPSLVLQGGSAITLSDSSSNTLLITKLSNKNSTISGGGEITEASAEVNSVLFNEAGGVIEANGRNALSIDIDRLVNNGVLEADNSTLTLHVDGAITGSGEAFVTNGGTIDMSEARQYFGAFRYAGAGTILGPDLVPAGTISGFATHDTYVFGKTNVLPDRFTTVWTENAAGTGGTLTVMAGSGQAYATLTFNGSYISSDFVATQVALEDGNHVALSFVGTLKWNQAVDGNWKDATMWDPTGLYAPGENDRALIAATTDPDKVYRVAVTQDTTVKSVSTGTRGAILDVKSGKYTVLDGSYTTANAGLVRVTGGASLTIGGTFAQAGSGRIAIEGQGSSFTIAKDGAITGGRIINKAGATWATAGGNVSLTGVNVENYGAMDIVKTTMSLSKTIFFSKGGSVSVGKGSTLALASSTIVHGTVSLAGTLRFDTDTDLRTTIEMSDTGRIVSNGTSVTFSTDGAISGGGQIGDSTMKLVNEGSITADAGKTLTVATGENAVVNRGHMLAMTGGMLSFGSELRNRGGLLASGGVARFDGAVKNVGTMQADGSGALLDYRAGLTNSGAISATDRSIVRLGSAVDQKDGGTLVASDDGTKILLTPGASVTGGQIQLGDRAELQVSQGGQSSLSNLTMTLEENAEVTVTNGLLAVSNSRIDADTTANIAAVNANSILMFTESTVDGGNIILARGKMLVGGEVTLTADTRMYMDNGSIGGVGSVAALMNAGFISASGTSTIGGTGLALANNGTIASQSSLKIDTGTNAVVNNGTLAASFVGSKLTIAGQVNNQESGEILSSSGTVQIGTLNNAGAVKATGVGSIGISGALINEGGVVQANAGGTIEAGASVLNTAGTIRANGSGSVVEMTAISLENDGTIEAKAGGTIDMLVDVNRGLVTATGQGSFVDMAFASTGGGNKGRIVADDDGLVAIDGDVVNSGGARLVAKDGGEVEVRGAVTGGIAVLSGDDSILDLQGSSTNDTTAQVSFAKDGMAELMLGHSSRFAGTVAGLDAGDIIDVTDIDFVFGKSSFDEANDQLIISDGTHTSKIQLLGQYVSSQFAFSSDGHGGTLVTTQALPVQMPDVNTLVAAHA